MFRVKQAFNLPITVPGTVEINNNNNSSDGSLLTKLATLPILLLMLLKKRIKWVSLHVLRACQLEIGTCPWSMPPTSIRIKSRAVAAADFQHP